MATPPIPINQQASWGSSVTIEELGPAGVGFKPRSVALLGSAMPFMGAEWGFENNLITTWYPGNAVEGTQQNLGPRELPSSWEGEWKRTLMGVTPSQFLDEQGSVNFIVSPHILREILEDIFRAGVRLRVTWMVQGNSFVGSLKPPVVHYEDVKIVREGLVKSFKTPIDRHTDIRWTAEFHWVSRGGTSDKTVNVRDDVDPSQAATSLEASVNVTQAAVSTKIRTLKAGVRKSASTLTLGQLEALAGAPLLAVNTFLRKLQQTVGKFKQVGDIALKLRSQPFAIANAVVDFARNTTAVANNFVDEIGRKPYELMTNKTKVSSLLRAAKYFGNVKSAAQMNARRGQELDDQIRKTLVSGANRGTLSIRNSASTRAGDIIAVHVCKSGETPQTVSSKFYKVADHGSDVLKANRMPLYTPFFRPGQILIIPSLAGTVGKTS